MSILRLDNVSYRYQDALKYEYVLKNINYEFELGKIYAIKGKSGNGKPTLLSLISGLELCREGNIYFEDKYLKNINLDKYRSQKIGIIFQSFNLLPHLTALENVMLSMDISGIKVKDKKKFGLDLLNKVGISETQANRRVLKLSGGEQQRVAIARSLSYDSKVILADESTGNLDFETENEIIKIFSSLALEGKCIIIVTHSKNVADQADKVFELKKKESRK